MKRVMGTFELDFTTEDKVIPENKMKNEITGLFAAALDDWMYNNGVEANEIHLMYCDDFTVEDYEE